MPHQTPTMTVAESALMTMLTAGPRDSREVIAAMLEAGASTKQTRTARERLGVVVCRRGRRADARSMWALPVANGQSSATCAPTNAQQSDAGPVIRNDKTPLRLAKVSGHLVRSERLRSVEVFHQTATPVLVRKGEFSEAHEPRRKAEAPAMSAEEAALLARRVAVFMARGLDRFVATDVATILVMQRDRQGSHDVSCVECQNFRSPGVCAVEKFSNGAREVRQLWFCCYCRRASI